MSYFLVQNVQMLKYSYVLHQCIELRIAPDKSHFIFLFCCYFPFSSLKLKHSEKSRKPSTGQLPTVWTRYSKWMKSRQRASSVSVLSGLEQNVMKVVRSRMITSSARGILKFADCKEFGRRLRQVQRRQ